MVCKYFGQRRLFLDINSHLSLKYQGNPLTSTTENTRVEEHRQRSLHGAITMTTLMHEILSKNPDTIFLHIGMLHPGDVFVSQYY